MKLIPANVLFSPVVFETILLNEANLLLERWSHKMGPLKRGRQRSVCHALKFQGETMGITTTSYLIAPRVGGAHHLTRENTVELSRLCAVRKGLCRVVLRLWREFVFPTTNFEWAMSYQDADLHDGNTYRFDGWQRIARSKSGPDTRSGRPGRDKWVWVYKNPLFDPMNDPMF
jgi:hypothetical protein